MKLKIIADSSHIIIILNELDNVKLIKFTLGINLMFSHTFNVNNIKDMQSKNNARSNFTAMKCKSYVYLRTFGFNNYVGSISAFNAPYIFSKKIANYRIITVASFKLAFITLSVKISCHAIFFILE